MKTLTVETRYYFLKPHEIQTETSNYHYVKIVNELMPDRAVWMQGYINHFGGVSTVGPPIMDEEIIAEFEAELKAALSTDSQNREDCIHFDNAQGRHKCVNSVVKSNWCNGVCKDYEPK